MSRVFPSRTALFGGIGLAVCGLLIPAAPASARVFFGIGIPLYPPPVYYPPPAYYPPPVYSAPPFYAAPPVYYAPPVQYTPPAPAYSTPLPRAQQTCFAGTYTCPMDRPTTSGASCYCPTNGGGRAWGRSN